MTVGINILPFFFVKIMELEVLKWRDKQADSRSNSVSNPNKYLAINLNLECLFDISFAFRSGTLGGRGGGAQTERRRTIFDSVYPCKYKVVQFSSAPERTNETLLSQKVVVGFGPDVRTLCRCFLTDQRGVIYCSIFNFKIKNGVLIILRQIYNCLSKQNKCILTKKKHLKT